MKYANETNDLVNKFEEEYDAKKDTIIILNY